jgi:hypothetical protein
MVMGLFKWVKLRMALADSRGGQKSVGVFMLTLGKMVVQGRTQQHQDDSYGQGDQEGLADEVLENGPSNWKCH